MLTRPDLTREVLLLPLPLYKYLQGYVLQNEAPGHAGG